MRRPAEDLPVPSTHPVFRAVVRVGTRALRWLLLSYFDVSVAGLENVPCVGSVIVAGNHPTVIDGLLLYLVGPPGLRFIAHRELFRHPLIRWLVRGLGFLPATRGQHVLALAVAALEGGDRVVVFPEGEVWDQGRMEEIHPGVGVMALRSGAPVVPLGIACSPRTFPLGAYLPRPERIAFQFGAPAAYSRETAEVIPEEHLVSVLVDCRRRILHAEAEARGRLAACPPAGPQRWLRVLASAPLLLPLVAVLTVTAREVRVPTDREG